MRRIGKMFLSLASLALLACSPVPSVHDGGGTGLAIEDATSVTENGTITVTITFVKNLHAPIVFTVHNGSDGTDGVFIKSLDAKISDDGNTLTVIIGFNDETKEPLSFDFSLKNGADGRVYTGMRITYEGDDSVSFVLQFDNGEESDPITIYAGKDGVNGKDGVSIRAIYVNESDGTVHIAYTDPTIPETVFAVKNGEDGRLITNITAEDVDNAYILTLYYSDGTSEQITIERNYSRWHYGNGAPKSDTGILGDLYMDLVNRDVYLKGDSGWSLCFSMKGEETNEPDSSLQRIHFDPNGGYWGGDQTDTGSLLILIARKTCLSVADFTALGEPQKDGYSFAGWWTSPDEHPNSGQLTTFTPIMGQATFYARWTLTKEAKR